MIYELVYCVVLVVSNFGYNTTLLLKANAMGFISVNQFIQLPESPMQKGFDLLHELELESNILYPYNHLYRAAIGLIRRLRWHMGDELCTLGCVYSIGGRHSTMSCHGSVSRAIFTVAMGCILVIRRVTML